MFIIEKKLRKFSAAHRLINGYKGKCRNLHGHNYKLAVALRNDKLDDHDLLIDFDVIKRLFDSYVQDSMDHAVLVSDADTELLKFVKKEQQRHYIIDGGRNTSVEVLAHVLYEKFQQLLDTEQLQQQVKLHYVKVFETDTAWATYSKDYQQKMD